MGLKNSPLYNINEKKLTLIGTIQEKNPNLYEIIKNDLKRFRKTTGWNPGIENYEYIMYAWLFAEKQYAWNEIRDLYKKNDEEIMELLDEFHNTLKKKGKKLSHYLAGIYKKTVEISKHIVLGRNRINSLNDAADIYKENFWFFKMYSGMEESLKRTKIAGEKGANFIEEFKSGITKLYLQDEINKKNLESNTEVDTEADTENIIYEQNVRKKNDNSLDEIILDEKERIKNEPRNQEKEPEEEGSEEEELIQDEEINYYYDTFKKEFDGINDIAFYFQKNFEVVADKDYRIVKQACHFMELKETFNDNFKDCRIGDVNKTFDYRTRIEYLKNESIVESVVEEENPELIKASKRVLENGEYDKQFDYSFYGQFRMVRYSFIAPDSHKMQNEFVTLTKNRVEAAMQIFNNRHRYWFAGPDSTAMSNLKKSCKRLLNTKPYGIYDDSFPSRYLEALYDTLSNALEYKAVKDEQGRDLPDRTQMGRERYTANDKLIYSLIDEIKRAENKLNPIYKQMRHEVDHPEINFQKSRLMGLSLLERKTEDYRKQNHAAYLFCRGIMDSNKFNIADKGTNIRDLEKVLLADDLFKEYARGDIYTKPAFVSYAASMKDIYIPKIGKIQPKTMKKIEIISTKDEDDKTEAITHKNDRIIINPAKLKQQSDELLDIRTVTEYRKKKEADRRKVYIKSFDDQTKKNVKEIEKNYNARQIEYMIQERNKEIRKRYNDYIRSSGKMPELITNDDKEKIKENIGKKIDDERTQIKIAKKKEYPKKLIDARIEAKDNEALMIQQRVNKDPFQFLLDEMQYEVKIRKLDLNDVTGIVNSAYRSFYYHAIMDEYARKLGVDPKMSDKFGAYSPEVIREQMKNVTPKVKEDADKFLKSAMLYGIEFNEGRINKVKRLKFGQEFKQKIEELLGKAKTEKGFYVLKHLSHTGILELRDEVMTLTFQTLNRELSEKQKVNDRRGEKYYAGEIQKHKTLAQSFASKVLKDNNEIGNNEIGNNEVNSITLTSDVGFDKGTPKPIFRR